MHALSEVFFTFEGKSVGHRIYSLLRRFYLRINQNVFPLFLSCDTVHVQHQQYFGIYSMCKKLPRTQKLSTGVQMPVGQPVHTVNQEIHACIKFVRIRVSHLSAYELNHTGFHHYIITVTHMGICTCTWLYSIKRESRELDTIFCEGKGGTDPGGDRNRGETYCRGQQTHGRGTRMGSIHS